jgi:hypothetical protein
MINTIWQTAVGTPWWVYVLLFILIVIGIQASKTRTVTLYKLFIMPIFFSVMAIHSLTAYLNITFISVGSLASAALIGILLGFAQVYHLDLQVDQKKRLLKMPGTWSTMALILIIFISKYYFGYEIAIDPSRLQDTHFEIMMLLVSGICTGLFIGKLAGCLYHLQHGPHVNLTEN